MTEDRSVTRTGESEGVTSYGGKPFGWSAGAIVGQLDEPVPHTCEPGRYEDGHGGALYANDAPEGSVWECVCGALYVHRWRSQWPSDGADWKPLTRREEKRFRRLAPSVDSSDTE